MKVGVHIPQVGRRARADVIAPFVRAVEVAGFDSLWVFDHVVIRKEQGSRYPYSADGRLGFDPLLPFIEPLTLLSYVAAITSRVQLGTSVLVLPMRQPVLHAKILASLDHLSGGRLILGAGVGWWKEEFEVMGMPFEQRGARMEEYLQLLRELWTKDWTDFRGRFYTCVDWTCNPKPVHGTIPIWLGGENRRQLERVGRLADGWHATWASLPTLRQDFAVAQEAAAKAGRDPAALSLSIEGAGMIASDEMGRLQEELLKLAEQGVGHAIVSVHPREMARAEELLQRFGAEYLPAVQAAAA